MGLNVTKIINALKKRDDIEFFDPGGGHGQGWRIRDTDFSGSIPLTSHGLKNLPAAIKQLNKALKEAGIELEF
ncbi:hypothetical protein [Microcoleus sp. B4-C1]|uniref:hypothetical protein n=1 Tax=Microcoleus sp. B4-C1 TaxID=2818660 RepID=UPI002FD1DD96